MSKQFKVVNHCIRGSNLELWMKLAPLLIKAEKPTSVIIHLGTNNIASSFVDTSLNVFKSLMDQILNVDQNIKVAVSSLITQRNYAHLFWIKEFNARLSDMCIMNNWTYIANDNIDCAYLARDGLHLNRAGVSLLARNYISYIQGLSSQDFHMPPFHWKRN